MFNADNPELAQFLERRSSLRFRVALMTSRAMPGAVVR